MKGCFPLIVALFTTGVLAQSADPNEVLFSGRIVDALNAGVGGAKVRIYDVIEYEQYLHPVEYVGEIVSEGDGAFAFVRRRERLQSIHHFLAVIEAEGFCLGWTNIGRSLTKLPTIKLEKPGPSISGRVVDSEDQPVEGAVVCALVTRSGDRRSHISGLGIHEFSYATDSDGRFSFDRFPSTASIELGVVKEGYARTFSFRTDKAPRYVYRAGSRGIVLKLMREASLVGVLVRSDTGDPLPGETVSLIRGQGEGTSLGTRYPGGLIVLPKTPAQTDYFTLETGPEGEFRLGHLVPGDYTLFQHNADGVQQNLFSRRMKFRIEEGQSVRVKLEVDVGQPVELRGIIRPGDAPAAAMRLVLKKEYAEGEARYAAFDSAAAESDAQGRFLFRIPAGKYKLEAASKAVDLAEAGQIIDTANLPETLHFSVKQAEEKREQGGVLKGVCTDTENRPMEGVLVYLISDLKNVVRTDREGVFELNIDLDGCRANATGIFLKRQSRDEDPDLLPVYLMNRPELLQRVEEGRMRPDAWMGVETCLVAETHDRSQSAIVPYYSHFLLMQPSGEMRIVLKPSCLVSGRILNEEGVAATEHTMQVDLEDDRYGEASYRYGDFSTDAEGRFRFAIPAGSTRYLMTATEEHGGVFIKRLRRAVGKGRVGDASDLIDTVEYPEPGNIDAGDFVVSAAVKKVSGAVVDQWGRGIRDVEVRLYAPEQGIEVEYLETGEDGRFEFSGLCRGRVQVSAKHQHSASRFTHAGDENVRLIVFDKTIPQDRLSDKPVASAAIELTIVDQATGEPVDSSQVSVGVRRKGGEYYQPHPPGPDGKLWFFVDAGEYAINVSGKEETYWRKQQNVRAELYEVYHVRFELEPTRRLLAQRAGRELHFPEFLSDDGEVWEQRAADRYEVLDVQVLDKITGNPVSGAAVLMRVNNGKGRFWGLTESDGKSFFGLTSNATEIVLASVTADGYLENRPAKRLSGYGGSEVVYLLPRIAAQSDRVYWPEHVFPEFLNAGIWTKRFHSDSNYHHLIVIAVKDRVTGEPVPNADVLVVINKGAGRYLGQTDFEGRVYFAQLEEVDEGAITAISAQGYKIFESQQTFTCKGRAGIERSQTLEQAPSFVKVRVIDSQGNAAGGVYVKHYYFRERWNRHGNFTRTDENGWADIEWIRETGTEPQIDHFLEVSHQYSGNQSVAALRTKGRAGDTFVLRLSDACKPRGRVVDEQGNGIRCAMNFDYIINGGSITGPPVQTDEDGFFYKAAVAPGFEYRIKSSRTLADGRYVAGELHFSVPAGGGQVEIPDLVLVGNESGH